MPKATPNRCAICTTTALSAPCCINNKAVSTQMRVTARWYSDPYLYALIKVNVRDYRSMNKNTEKMTAPMIQVKTSVFPKPMVQLRLNGFYQNIAAHCLT